MRPLYCTENPPCMKQCRACKEAEVINAASMLDEERERQMQADAGDAFLASLNDGSGDEQPVKEKP